MILVFSCMIEVHVILSIVLDLQFTFFWDRIGLFGHQALYDNLFIDNLNLIAFGNWLKISAKYSIPTIEFLD